MFSLYKPAGLTLLCFLLIHCYLPSSSLANETDHKASIDRYRQALKVDPDNPTLHYILGLAQLKYGYANEAIASFRTAYPAYTDSVEMHYNMGLAFSQAGDADSALIYLERAETLGALGMPEVFPLVNAYYNVGLIYLEQEALPEAAELLKRVLTLDPERMEIYRLLGDISARSGQSEAAIELFTTYLDRYPGDQAARDYLYALHFNRALKQMEAGDDKSARISFEAAGDVAPGSPIVSYYLGSLAYTSGDAETAIAQLAPAYATIPKELQDSTRSMLYNSVLRSINAQKPDQAVTGITPLIRAADVRSKDLILAGTVYSQRQEYKLARDMFTRVLNNEPAHPQATINLAVVEEKAAEILFQEGLAAYQNNLFSIALELFDEALSILPGDRRSSDYRAKTLERIASEAENYINDGRKALSGNNYLQAIMFANKGLELVPSHVGGQRLRQDALKELKKDVTYLLENGFALLQKSEFVAAEANFKKILQIDPGNKRAQGGLAQCTQQRQIAALAEITKGNAALDEGKLEVAGAHFTLAEKLVADLPELIDGRVRLDALVSSMVSQELQWGRRARSAGDLQQAETHFKNALTLRNTPEIRHEINSIKLARNQQADGLLSAARTAYSKKDFKTSRNIYHRILNVDPQHPMAAVELKTLDKEIASTINDRLKSARTATSNDQHQQALTDYRSVLDLEPGNKEALQGLRQGKTLIEAEIAKHLEEGLAAFKRGEFKAATDAYNKALSLDPYQVEANAAIRKIAALEQTGTQPGDEHSLYLQGIELYTSGKYSDAIKTWQKVLQLDPEHDKARMNIEKAKRKLQSIREFQSG